MLLYKYKLTFELDTPSGIRQGTSIVGVYAVEQRFPQPQTNIWPKGEAVFVDMEPCPRPLVALLSSANRPSDQPARPRRRWGDIQPGFVLESSYGKDPAWSKATRTVQAALADTIIWDDYLYRDLLGRGPRPVAPEQLPDLVTFGDLTDPQTVASVDPLNLEGALCPGVSWRSITFELVDEPITWGLTKRLPWLQGLKGYLDGESSSHISPGQPLANKLSRINFIFGDQ